MKYLVTGGAGFIGSHLTEAILARGDEVVALDNLSTGSSSNLGDVDGHAGFRFVAGSVLDELLVDELMRDVDVVVHLAAAVGVKLIVEQPLKSFITNIRGGETIVAAAHRYRKRVLIASTSEVYGKNGHSALRETDDRVLGAPSVSRWSYSTAKVVDEILALAYHRERGLESTVVRFFNTVGGRQSPAYGMVIPRFVHQALGGEPLTIFGDGSQTRCFCHVDDVVRATLMILDDPRTVGEVYNVGSQEEISIRDLADCIISRTNSSSPLEFIPYSRAYNDGFEDMARRVPDTTKLHELVGWEPRLTLDDILREVIEDAASGLAIDLRTLAPTEAG